MKSLTFMALVLASLNSFAAQSSFKTIFACQMVDKTMEMNINVLKDTKGATRMEIKPEGQRPFTVNARELLAPPMMAGGATRYVAKDPESQGEIVLSIYARPIKVGSVVGKSAKISVQGLFSDLGMVCKGL